MISVAINIGLTILAGVLLFTLSIPAILITLINPFCKRSYYFLKIAICLDQLGNVVCESLFNMTLITEWSTNKFGNPDETISSVLGKNKKANTLTWLGKLISKILNKIEVNHVEKSIKQ